MAGAGTVVLLVAALVPPAIIAAKVARYGVNVPFWDQWAFVPALAAALDGDVSLATLWMQHNEHRLVLPRLVMFALARATQWNTRAEMAASLVVALCILATLALLVRRTVRPLAPALAPWLVVVASLLFFTPAQWENWTWGWQIQIFLNVFAVVLGAAAVARWGASRLGIAAIVVAAIAGSLSFASGLVLVALVPVAVGVAAAAGGERPTFRRLLAVLAVAGGLVAIYLHGFEHPVQHPALSTRTHDLLLVARYVPVYLGGGFGTPSMFRAGAWGTGGIILFTAAAGGLWWRSPAHRPALVPWVLLAAYAVLAGVITGVGRVGFGVEQALSARYVGISALFWISLGVVGGLAATHFVERTTRRGTVYAIVALTACIVTLAAEDYAASWARGETLMKSRRRDELLGRACVLHADTAPDACLRLLFPDVDRVRTGARDLARRRLGPFADGERATPRAE